MARQYDAATRQLRQTIEVFPNYVNPYATLGMSYLFKGMHHEALDVFQHAAKLGGGASRWEVLVAYTRASAGDKTDCEWRLKEYAGQPGVSPLSMALLYLGLGDKDHVFEQLRKGVEQYSMYIDQLKVIPLFDSLHGDRRYHALLRQMNLN